MWCWLDRRHKHLVRVWPVLACWLAFRSLCCTCHRRTCLLPLFVAWFFDIGCGLRLVDCASPFPFGLRCPSRLNRRAGSSQGCSIRSTTWVWRTLRPLFLVHCRAGEEPECALTRPSSG